MTKPYSQRKKQKVEPMWGDTFDLKPFKWRKRGTQGLMAGTPLGTFFVTKQHSETEGPDHYVLTFSGCAITGNRGHNRYKTQQGAQKGAHAWLLNKVRKLIA